MMFGVLDRYIGRTIVSTIMMTLFLLVSLSAIIKFVDQLRAVGSGDYTTLGAGLFTLMTIPKDIEVFFPMAALLGALLGLGSLATRSELVVMQAAGFTKMNVAMAVLKTALPLMLLTMAIGEWVAPQGEQAARNMRAQMIHGGTVLTNKWGMWAKDGSDFIYIQRVVNENGASYLNGLNIYHFDESNTLQSVRQAEKAEFNAEQKVWQLLNIEESDLTSREKITGRHYPAMEWKTTLTPDKLGIVGMRSESLSISSLYNYIHYLKASGQEAKGYELNFWKKLLAPLSVMVMMLMALSFIFGPLRSVPMGMRIITGIVFGFVFFLLNEVFGKLGLVSHFHPIWFALLPSLLFLLLSVYLLRRRN